MLVAGKVALVTGASRGIGQAIALKLGREGAVVMGTATTAEGAEKINAAFREANIQGAGYALNVGNSEAVQTSSQRRKIILALWIFW